MSIFRDARAPLTDSVTAGHRPISLPDERSDLLTKDMMNKDGNAPLWASRPCLYCLKTARKRSGEIIAPPPLAGYLETLRRNPVRVLQNAFHRDP